MHGHAGQVGDSAPTSRLTTHERLDALAAWLDRAAAHARVERDAFAASAPTRKRDVIVLIGWLSRSLS